MVENDGIRSRFGFLMVASGCAVGLGNVWRFPFVTGRNGGFAFVIVYLIFLALLGYPLLTAELAIGRASGEGVSGALARLAPLKTRCFWKVIGSVIFLGNLLLMMYYTDVCGWLLEYFRGYLVTGTTFVGSDIAGTFTAKIANASTCFWGMLVTVIIAVGVCMAGIQSGVERVSKVLMTTLFVLLILLAARALTLPNAIQGVVFYLKPDFGPLLAHPLATCFDAMGQAFFTLSVGVGCMTAFGGYIGRKRSLASDAMWIVILDTLVALLSGLVIFPICAAYGVDVSSGPGLIFIALPEVFAHMDGGRFWGTLFFLFLAFAALTTVIGVFECLIGGIISRFKLKRWYAAIVVGIIVMVLSLPAVLGYGPWKEFSPISNMTFLDIEDFVMSQLWLPLGAFAICIFCTRSFGWGISQFIQESSSGEGFAFPWFLVSYMRWILPLALIAILVFGLLFVKSS